MLPPFDLKRLRAIAKLAVKAERIDLRPAVSWLGDVLNEDELRRRIVQAWRGSATPLRDWADGIRRVELCLESTNFWLRVDLQDGRQVRQYPPLAPEYLDSLLAEWPQQPPAVVLDVARAAPGLKIGETGALASPRFFQERMGYVTWWNAGVGPSAKECRQMGLEYPDPEVFLAEVAEDGIGNVFVLKQDGTTYLFDHEESVFRRCLISVEDLFAGYFTNQEIVFDDAALGLQRVPTDALLPPEAEPPQFKAVDAHSKLSTLAQLGFAVRMVQRARPGLHVVIPSRWQAHLDRLDGLIEVCREVCVSGKPLQASTVETMDAATRSAADRWDAIAGYHETYPGAEFAEMVRRLVAAAGNLNNDILTRLAANQGCRWFRDQDEAWWATIHADIDWLSGCGLGSAESVGKPVPEAFFERPL